MCVLVSSHINSYFYVNHYLFLFQEGFVLIINQKDVWPVHQLTLVT